MTPIDAVLLLGILAIFALLAWVESEVRSLKRALEKLDRIQEEGTDGIRPEYRGEFGPRIGETHEGQHR